MLGLVFVFPLVGHTGYGPPKGGSSYLSPVDSAIGSGVTSGVTTKAPSVVADGDLEVFDDEEQVTPGYPSYPGYSEQQTRGEVESGSYCWCVGSTAMCM